MTFADPNHGQRLPTRDAIRDGQWERLADECSFRIGADVSPEDLRKAVESWRDTIGHPEWIDATYRHWLICRAVETLPPVLRKPDAVDNRVSCVFHVFWLWIDTTHDEELRLLNETLRSDDDVNVPRSKLAKELRRVRPIDRVAKRVAPPPE